MQFYHCERRLDRRAANVYQAPFPCQAAGHSLQIAADQTSEAGRPFALMEYVEEIVASLPPNRSLLPPRRGQGGTGLGLNIVYNPVVIQFRGTVTARSTVGRGTRFTLRIPRVTPQQNGAETGVPESAAAPPAF
jgi:hypothetical protein